MKSDLPFVSCLMPTKNRRQFIPSAAKMWQAQDYPNRELIIIEDGDDNVSDLIPRSRVPIDTTRPNDHFDSVALGPSKYRISYCRFEGTLGAKLNYGAQIAAGSILFNWDDDDFNSPKRISQQVTHMQLSRKPFVGMSSLIFYHEGDPDGWEYTGDAWYAPGSTHCYTKEYALAHPRPDRTVGEDSEAVELANKLGALSSVSGLTSLVARDHESNCSRRHTKSEFELLKRMTCDNFRLVPLSLFAETVTI